MQPLHNQHNDNEEIRRPHFRQGEKPITSPQSAELKHSVKIVEATRHPRRTENYPSHNRQEERQQHLPSLLESGKYAPFGHLIRVFPVLARKD